MSQGKLEVYYDEHSDVLYFGAKGGAEEECVEIAPGFNVELDQARKIVGVELHNASQVLEPIINKMK